MVVPNKEKVEDVMDHHQKKKEEKDKTQKFRVKDATLRLNVYGRIDHSFNPTSLPPNAHEIAAFGGKGEITSL